MGGHDRSSGTWFDLGPKLRHGVELCLLRAGAEHEPSRRRLHHELRRTPLPAPDGIPHDPQAAYPCSGPAGAARGLVIGMAVVLERRDYDCPIRYALRERLRQLNFAVGQSAIGHSETKNVSLRQPERAHCAYKLPATDRL